MYTAKRGYRPGDEPVPAYHLTKFLGRGQFGEVWQAKGPGGMQVALKIIDLAEREGLKEFAGLQRVKDIRHANLVEFVACWVKTEDGQVLDEVPADPGATLSTRDSSVEIGGTMLFAEGGAPTRPVELIVAMSLGSKTLFKRLQEVNHGKEQKVWTGIPDNELLDYMEQAARGIDFLNRQGIIHGDIKPQNLLIVGDSVKVCDFGLAQAVDSLRKTQSGMGTVAYAAPELFEGKPHVQSDQYCLAISYVELHTGSLPFDEPNPYKVIELHRHGKLDLQKLTSRDRSVIKRATEIKPERRWPCCFEMVSKLRESRQQERAGKGGGWFSILGGRSQPTERLPPVEELPDKEPLEPDSGREAAAKKGSGGLAPAKKDSGRKKSGPQSPAAARAVQTQRPRGDDTDAIAATVAREDLQEPVAGNDLQEPPPGPSVVGRLMKLAVVVSLIGVLAFVGYWFWPKGGGASKKGLLECAGRGEFDKAVAVDTKAKELLVAVEYDKWLADVRRDWSEPASNPILRRLEPSAPDAIEPREAARLMATAEAADDFRKLVDGVPAGLWQPISDKWVKTIEDSIDPPNEASLDQAIKDLEGASLKRVPAADKERLRTRIGQGYFMLIRDPIDRGNFQQAADVAKKAEGQLVYADYEKLCEGVRKEWAGLSTNPVLQQLNKGKIQAPEAIVRLKNADAEPRFVRLVGQVPESVWQAVLKPWINDFDARVAKGEFKEAADVLAGAKQQLVAERYMQLSDAVRKEWSEPSTNRVLQQLKLDEGIIAARDAALRLKNADAEESFVALVGRVPAGVWQAVLERWMKDFDQLLPDLAKAVEEWKAVNKWEDAPSELISPSQKNGLIGRLQEEWRRQTKFADLVAGNNFRGAKEELEKPLAKEIFDETGLGGIRKEVQPKWTVYFDNLLKTAEPEKLTTASGELKDVGKFFDSAEEYSRKATEVHKVWGTAIRAHTEKRDWVAAKKLFDSVTEEVIPREEREKELDGIRTAFDKTLDENFVPPVDKAKLDKAEGMLASVEPTKLLSQDEMGTKRKSILQKRAEMQAAVGRQEIDKNLRALISDKKWEEAKKTLDGASNELLPAAERGKRLVELQSAWGNAFQPLLDEDKLQPAGQMLAAAMSIRLFLPDEIEKKRSELEKKRVAIRDKWDTEFYGLFDKDQKEKDWAGALKKLDNPPPGVLMDPETQKRRSDLETAWKDVFGPLVQNGQFDEADNMLTSAMSVNLFPRTDIDTMRGSIREKRQQMWVVGFEKALKGKEWSAAKTMIQSAPKEMIPPEEHDKWLGQVKDEWDKDFNEKAKMDPDGAGKNMLALVPKGLFSETEIKERQERLYSGGIQVIIKKFQELFAKLFKDRKFREANDELDKIVALLPSDEVKTKKDDLRKDWVVWIHGNWSSSDPTTAFMPHVDAFLKAFPNSPEANDARLLRARALVHLGRKTSAPKQLSDAAEDLRALKAAAFPLDRAYVRDGLMVLASVNKFEDFRRDYPEEPKDSAEPWKLDRWEEEELKRIGAMPKPDSAIATIKKTLDALNDPQAKPDAARQLLDALEKLFPPADPGSWKVEDKDVVALLTGSVPVELGKLAAGVADGGPRYADQAQDLLRAKRWLQPARVKFPFPEIDAAIYAVATGRLAIRVWETPEPKPADWEEVQEWERLPKRQAGAGASGGEELMAKAWREECNVALGQNLMSARNSLVSLKDPLLAKHPAYARYLWCRALKAAGSSDVVTELNELVPALEGPEPILKKQGRAGKIAELIVEAAGERRKQLRPWKLDKVPFNPFGDQAEQYARLLKAARGLMGAGKNPELEVGLALASFHKAKPETDVVWPLAQEVLRSPDADKQADLLPLLFAGVSSFWQQPQTAKLAADDPQFVAGGLATVRLLQELNKDEAGKIAKKEVAAAVYDSILKPLLENPDYEAKIEAQKQAGNELLSDLSGAVAKFLENQQDAQWPRLPKNTPSVYHAIEDQATLAIDLAPKDKPNPDKLAGYYATRASARAYKTDWNVDAVLKDVDTALTHKPKLHGALGVRAYALFMRAGQQSKRDDILNDLAAAIAAGNEAVNNRPKENTTGCGDMLNLGLAHLHLGNYEINAEKKKQHFDAAKELASQAAKLMHEYDHSARFLLGNIYEDLASQVGEDPKQNYLEALKRFSEVLDRSPLSAQARASRARCILKALTTSRLNPQDIGVSGNHNSALKKCSDDLEEAVGFADQDWIRIEAYSQLGQVYEAQGDWTKADKSLGTSAELAKQSRASTRAAYVSAWAVLPLNHANRLRADDAEVPQLLNTAEQRAKQLEGIPAGAFTDPRKQIATILGSIWQKRKDYDKAVDAYGQALPKDLAEADPLDVPLLLARADCNLSRPEANRAAHLPAVLQDASRALALAPASREKADAHYRVALAHFWLWQADKAANQHRDQSLESIRKAVELVPPGVNGVTYRHTGATLIARIVGPILLQIDRKQAISFYEEAERWLKDASDAAQDSGKKKDIARDLELCQKLLEQLRGAPPAAPAPNPEN